MEKNKYRESVLYTINVYIPQLLLSFTGCLAWGNTVDEYDVDNHVLPPFSLLKIVVNTCHIWQYLWHAVKSLYKFPFGSMYIKCAFFISIATKVQWFPPTLCVLITISMLLNIVELLKFTGPFLSEQNLPAIMSVTLSNRRYFTTRSETVCSEAKCDKYAPINCNIKCYKVI